MNYHATTILAIKRANSVVMIGDGQVSLGHTVMKSNARKIRKLSGGNIVSGFAGSTSDAFTLFDRLEQKLEIYPNQLMRSATELAKDWRRDKFLRKLEAMMIVADENNILVLSGSGDVIEPEDGIVAIGSGGFYALSAARAMYRYGDSETPIEDIAKNAMTIASEICVYTNNNFYIERINCN